MIKSLPLDKNMFEKILFFILGAACGSFLNVCIHRLPLGETIIFGRSRCPHCRKTIPWYDNIPFISYCVLKGKCRFCDQKISFRYFTVELLTALVFLFCYNAYGASFDFIFYSIFICGLIVATFVDIQHRIIPDEVSVGGIAVGIILNTLRPLFSGSGFSLQPVWDSVVGAVAGGGIIYLIGFLFDVVYFKLLKKPPVEGETSSMGGGDVKLLAMIGAFLGWQKALLTFFLAPFLGLTIGIVNLVTKKQHILPYGPFLSLAAVINTFWAARLLALLGLR